MDLSPASFMVFSIASYEAKGLRCKYIDVEHIGIGLCKVVDIPPYGKEVCKDISDGDWDMLCKETKRLSDFLSQEGIDPKKTRRRLRWLIQESPEVEKGKFSEHRTERCREVFRVAESYARQERGASPKVRLEHLFLATLQAESKILEHLFAELGLDKSRLREKLKSQKDSENFTPFLDEFGRDITRLAREGKLQPCIGRKDEMRKLAQILLQRKKNNPLLVGEAGVGKTCIVEGLAQRIVQPDAHEGIRNLRIVEISMSSLVAGTRYRGDFEERVENILKEASSDPNIVLFIDEIHTMLGAGSGGDALDAANILKPALARGDIKCIGATTIAEYRKYIEKDQALERRFQVIWVEEPSREEAIEIIRGLRNHFENHYRMRVPDGVIEKAVDLSIRYLPDFRLPDKAIDIIDQACSRKLMKTLSPISQTGEREEITLQDLAAVISERSKIPVELLTHEEAERLLHLEEYLLERIKGQDHAVKEVSEAIRMAKAGLKNPQKPLVFAFFGPTGTGKTELAKAIAEFLFLDEKKLITFDMSEYHDRYEVAKLIGAPPGYVGYEEEGLLSKKVRTNPYSVLLFDEIEKAHPDVLNIFLQILDEGRLTDSHGRRINFSETIIIFTSNLGATVPDSQPEKEMGFKMSTVESYGSMNEDHQDYAHQVLEAVRISLKPEFVNRIQRMIVFHPLSRESVRLILDKFLKRLNERLSSRKIEIRVSEEAKSFLIDKGYSETYGARELERAVEGYISEPVSKMILEGNLKEGDKLGVFFSDEGKLLFQKVSEGD